MSPNRSSLRFVCAASVLLGAITSLGAQELRLSDGAAFADSDSVRLEVLVSHDDVEGLSGFSFGLDHDETVLVLEDVAYLEPGFPGGFESLVITSLETDFFTIGVLFFDGAAGTFTTLEPGSYPLVEVVYGIDPLSTPQRSDILFAELGPPPPVANLLIFANGTEVEPDLVDGFVQILEGAPDVSVPANQLWFPSPGGDNVSVVDSLIGEVIAEPSDAGQEAPSAVAVGPTGAVWVAFADTDRLVGFDANDPSVVLDSIDLGVGAAPAGLAIDAFGDLWVSNFGSDSLTKVSAAGEVLFGEGGLIGAEIGSVLGPRGLAGDPPGNLWVAASGGDGELVKLGSDGQVAIRVSDFGIVGSPFDVAVEPSGFVWVTLPDADRVQRYSPDGVLVDDFELVGAGPEAIVVRGQSEAWVAGADNGMIYRLRGGDPDGCGDGDPSECEFPAGSSPSGIAIGGLGQIWVVDATDETLQQYDEAGATVGVPIALTGAAPEFVGDASGYALANVLFRQQIPGTSLAVSGALFDLDQDSLPNSFELDGGTDPLDLDPDVVAPVSALSCIAVGGEVLISWSNAQDYEAIRVVRDGVEIVELDGSSTEAPIDTPGDGTFEYEIVAVSGSLEAVQRCVVTVGLGSLLGSTRVDSVTPALNLFGVSGSLQPSLDDRRNLAIDTANNQIYVLDAELDRVRTIESPFPSESVVRAVALFEPSSGDRSIFVGGNNSSGEPEIRQLSFAGEQDESFVLEVGGTPVEGEIASIAAIEDPDQPGEAFLYVAMLNVDTCDIWGVATDGTSFAVDVERSFEHPTPDPVGASGVAFPRVSSFSDASVDVLLTLPTTTGFEVSLRTVTFGVGGTPGSVGDALLDVSLDAIDGESALGGIAVSPSSVVVTGLSTSRLHRVRTPEFLRGDCSGNGVVSPIPDGIYLLEWMFLMGPEPPCFDSADVDDDGVTSALLDTLYLLMWFFDGGPVPPSPGPDECGYDRTPDTITCEIESSSCQ